MRQRRGDLGRWPVVVALALIAAGFQIANDAFLSSRNLSNLVLQTGTLAILTLGVMLVLVLGEIDLSIGAVAGLTACIMGLLSAVAGWPAWAAILVALALGAAIGCTQGAWIVLTGAPSFIVTLAGMLVWQGLQLLSLQSQNGQLRIEDSFITGLAATYLPRAAGWALAVVVMIAGLVLIGVRRILTARSGYDAEPLRADVFRAVLVVAVPLAITVVLDHYLGVPYLLVITLVITGILSVVTSSTVFGRHLYAVGGNAEASRRTGVRVNALRMVIFTMVSTLAAVAGVLSASRNFSVSVNTGGGNTTLNAIAAAVIGAPACSADAGRSSVRSSGRSSSAACRTGWR